MSAMVFYSPTVVKGGAGSGSGVRPYRMREAFGRLGYEVIDVSGRHRERHGAMARARERVDAGGVEFVYAEMASTPVALTEPITARVDPRADFAFLRHCRSRGVPVGAFYRDVYWRFPGYLRQAGAAYGLWARAHYAWELRRLDAAVDVLFLPTMRMGEYVPRVDPAKFRELPPGAPVGAASEGEAADLFYVGALGDYYDLSECAAAVAATPGATLTMCVPPDQWRAHRAAYEPFLGGGVSVVHGRGEDLDPYYARAGAGVLAMRPVEYRAFAAPVKLFEYIGRSLPVLASQGTYVGDFVARTGTGWTLPYDREAIAGLLARLVADPGAAAGARAAVRRARGRHTWEARARQAAQALTGA